EAQPLPHRRALVRVEMHALTGPDQRLDPLRGELEHQRAAHVHREDLALEPQRGPAEPAAAPGRGDSVGADQLVDQVLETLLRAVARCALLSHRARVPRVPTSRRAGLAGVAAGAGRPGRGGCGPAGDRASRPGIERADRVTPGRRRAGPLCLLLTISLPRCEPSRPAVREPVWTRPASRARGSRPREPYDRGARMIPMTQFRLKPARGARRWLSVATIASAGALAPPALRPPPAGAAAHGGAYRQ